LSFTLVFFYQKGSNDYYLKNKIDFLSFFLIFNKMRNGINKATF
jgi:hypothetical protein